MLGAHVFVGLAHVGRVVLVERGAQRVERRAPELVARQQRAEGCERLRLRLRGRRALVGGVSRGRAIGDEVVAVVGLRVVGADRDVGERKPVGGILGRRRDRGCCQFLRGVELAGGRGGRSGLAKDVGRLAGDRRADLRRGDAKRFGEPHRVARHVLALIGPGLGREGGGRRQQQKEKRERAKRLTHRGLSPSFPRRIKRGGSDER